MIKMMALRKFTYAGKRLLPGAEFKVSLNRDVRLLSVMGHAMVSVEEKISAEEPEMKPSASIPEIEVAYPQPDLDPQPETEAEITPEDPPKKSRRRYYRRRDMKAEDD